MNSQNLKIVRNTLYDILNECSISLEEARTIRKFRDLLDNLEPKVQIRRD